MYTLVLVPSTWLRELRVSKSKIKTYFAPLKISTQVCNGITLRCICRKRPNYRRYTNFNGSITERERERERERMKERGGGGGRE